MPACDLPVCDLRQFGKKVRVADDAMFERFNEARAGLLGRQCRQSGRVNHHHGRLFDRTDQILALREIDSCLAAYAGVDHCEQCGREVGQANPPHKGGGRKARYITGHASAQRQDGADAPRRSARCCR